MNAWVRTDCPACGPIYLPAVDVKAWKVLPAAECSYTFACRHCRRLVERRCSRATIDELIGCGVPLTTLVAPPPVRWQRDSAASDPPCGPGAERRRPLRETDVEVFSRLLADEDAFARALRRLENR
jgi:hypothetical protein